MTEDTICAVALKLSKDFDNCKVYAENVEQNMVKPCFTIGVKKKNVKNLLGNRKIYRCKLCVHYIGKNKSKAEMNQITDKLFKSLEFVSCLEEDVILRGENMSAEISDNDREIDFFVEYAFTVFIKKEKEDAEIMESHKTMFKSRFAY